MGYFLFAKKLNYFFLENDVDMRIDRLRGFYMYPTNFITCVMVLFRGF